MAGLDSYSGIFPGTLTYDGHRIECLVTVYGTLCDTLDVWVPSVPSDESARTMLYIGGGVPALCEVLLS
jgi:hypothetical protein